jgi:hypothetical protein
LALLYIGISIFRVAQLDIQRSNKGVDESIVYEGVQFRTIDDLYAMLDQDEAWEFYRIGFFLPADLLPLFVSIIAGALGAISACFHPKRLGNLSYFSLAQRIIFGSCIGFAFGSTLKFLVDSLTINISVSYLAGIFPLEYFRKLQTRAKKL